MAYYSWKNNSAEPAVINSTASAAAPPADHLRIMTTKKTWSNSFSNNNESTQIQGMSKAACVCAPTTHAGSFKCRLHRVINSQGHHQHAASSSPTTTAHQSSSAPQPAVSTSSTRTTVEAQ